MLEVLSSKNSGIAEEEGGGCILKSHKFPYKGGHFFKNMI